MNSIELYEALERQQLDIHSRDPYWWPNSGTFEVIVGAILTQQTKWQKVEKSLANLQEENLLSPEALAAIDLKELQLLIKPSGFYNTKAKYIKGLCQNIVEAFGDFEAFQREVSREWLLEQKGIGEESADSILCYGCYRPVMVCDAYTSRLLQAFGYEFERYGDMQEWMVEGFSKQFDDLHRTYAAFHAMIVEYAKVHSRGKSIAIDALSL
jgi:endonuclease-3 related protein